jgi:hypothetical protein
MANGDPLKAGMGVTATDVTSVDAALHPLKGPSFLVRSFVYRTGAPVTPTPWSTEHIAVQAEGPTGVLASTFNSNGAAVAGIGRSPFATGLFGSGGQRAVWGNGIPSVQAGTTAFSPGAEIGVTGDSVGTAGVFGYSLFGIGVLGRNDSGGQPGVRGEATTSGGVEGVSVDAPGVFGESVNSLGVVGRSNADAGVSGQSQPGPGVRGYSGDGTGVLGLSERENGVVGFGSKNGVAGASRQGSGVVGSTRRGPAGVLAIGDSIALRAVSARTAGYFEGDVIVDRDLLVLGAKSAVVRSPEGSLRQLYCVEAPEPWFEDQGEGKLVEGVGEIALDPQFAAAVKGAYQVQLTPYAPVLLWVAARGKARFTVRAQALPGGKLPRGPVAFSWRVIARRGDLARAKRFADVTLPALAELPAPPAWPKTPKTPSASPALKIDAAKTNPFGERLASAKDLATRRRG